MEEFVIVIKAFLAPKNNGALWAPLLKLLFQKPLILVFACILLFSGCGYATRLESLKHIDSVTISPLSNETSEYGLEEELGDTIKQEFFRRPSIRSEGSDSLFTATIRNYRVLPLTRGQSNQPEEYRIILSMSYVFQDSKRNKIIRDEKNYEKLYDFYVITGRGKPPEDLKTAKSNLIKEASQDIVNSIFEEW